MSQGVGFSHYLYQLSITSKTPGYPKEQTWKLFGVFYMSNFCCYLLSLCIVCMFYSGQSSISLILSSTVSTILCKRIHWVTVFANYTVFLCPCLSLICHFLWFQIHQLLQCFKLIFSVLANMKSYFCAAFCQHSSLWRPPECFCYFLFSMIRFSGGLAPSSVHCSVIFCLLCAWSYAFETTCTGSSNMAQRVTVLATYSDELSSIPETHMVLYPHDLRQLSPTSSPLTSTHVLWHVSPHTK